MKRINPKTGQPFKRGDRREDGYYFGTYRVNKPIRKDGYFREEWWKKEILPSKYKTEEDWVDGVERINPETEKPFEKGDRRIDGYYFYRYRKHLVDNDGFFIEMWSKIPPTDYESKEVAGIKRSNPDTGIEFKMGDIREDGKVFITYQKAQVRKDGTYSEYWAPKDEFDKRIGRMISFRAKSYEKYDPKKHKRNLNPKTGAEWKRGEYDPHTNLYFCYYVPEANIKTKLCRERWLKIDEFIPFYLKGNLDKIKAKCKKKNIPFGIDYAYLTEIFPEDMMCPALGIKMEFGGSYHERQNSPSIDRLYPAKGYVKGNIRFVSYLANAIMNEADPDEVIRVGKWLESEGAFHRNPKRK